MPGKKYKIFSWEKRLQLEALYTAGVKPKEIAAQLGVHLSTIYRELKRGMTTQKNSDWTERKIYSPNLAQYITEQNLHERGRENKVGNDYKFIRHVEKKIITEKYSPAAVLMEIHNENLKFKTNICLTTCYNYIKKGIFLNLTMAACPYRKTRTRQKKKKVQKRLQPGKSIDERSKDILTRNEFGHWEMDTVVSGRGKSKKSILVFTERKQRIELLELLNEHTAAEVVRVLDKMERKFGERQFRETFKTITVDNGTEFSDWKGIERSRRNKKKRTKLYYCHPYSSCERGSNENQNKLVRRWYPKGMSFENIKNINLKSVENWINKYPRKMFNGLSAYDLLQASGSS
jgi:IS30 family transposase